MTDEDMHSKPIYGLIFLFRWREDDPEKQEATCPDGIWFANQVRFPVTGLWSLLLSAANSTSDG